MSQSFAIKALTLIALKTILLLNCLACGVKPTDTINTTTPQPAPPRNQVTPISSIQSPLQNTGRLLHVVVALCDNQYQGIVPVPARIGNGDDPQNNLYWGAAFGVKHFFKTSSDWTVLLDIENPRTAILERIVFKHRSKDLYLVADAYRGREIRQATVNFLRYAAGRDNEVIELSRNMNRLKLNAGGGADLVAYVGHDGLMDFSLSEYPHSADERRRDVIILACASKFYFREAIQSVGADPLLWTTGLMAPEAYILKAAIDGWAMKESREAIRRRAAEAYNRYQRCGMPASLKLFSTGW